MLYAALVVAGLLLICANVAIWIGNRPSISIAVLGFAFSVGTICLVVLLPVWELAALLVCFSLLLASIDRKRLFFPASLASMALVFGLNSWWAWHDVKRLQHEYPFETLEGRLPERPTRSEPVAKDPSVLSEWEKEIGLHSNPSWREHELRRLHEDAVAEFIERPNFGAGRMTGMTEFALQQSRRDNGPVPQPGVRSSSAGAWDEVGKEMLPEDELRTMHKDGAFDFLRPLGFGYYKDRQHVAGFASHEFSKVPEAKRWRVQTLDLVGLVVHPKPVAYISDDLPRMDELRKAPTRDLNAFESAGLAALRGGDDLFVRQMPDGNQRMLGAVRALRQCIDCHGGARGDLLGAFSYELRPVELR